MAIREVDFDSEKELDDWVAHNISFFLPASIYIPGCTITTVSGKNGIPDGFAFNLEENEWYVIEAELLKHGVWPHIAEQIVRFVVATQNPQTRRIVRDRIFEHLEASGALAAAAKQLNTTTDRLLQQLELFVEGIDPGFVIFIDNTNQDLYDMVHALSAPTKVFQVRKFLVNGKCEYYSPDQNAPIIETEPGETGGLASSEYEIIDLLGGEKVETSTPDFKCYRLQDGTIIYAKRSKYYTRHEYYWYGIQPRTLDKCAENKVTHIVFIMGDEGFAKVPIETVLQFVKITRFTKNDDGTVRHYHILISPGPDPKLYWSQDKKKFDLKQYYQTF